MGPKLNGGYMMLVFKMMLAAFAFCTSMFAVAADAPVQKPKLPNQEVVISQEAQVAQDDLLEDNEEEELELDDEEDDQ